MHEANGPFAPGDLPAIDGQVRGDVAELARASQDWGHIVQARPRVVVYPCSVADVAAVLEFAAARGVPVAARGAGHSPFGQSQAESGIVLDMTGLADVHAVTSDHVVVDAGARWRDVLAETLPHGLAPPVLTDYLGLTVGGTLTAGGIGGASQHYGTQTDTVTELDVVTGTGQRVTCSAGHRRELFDVVRAGLGTCGVLTRASLRLVPAQQRARRWLLYYATLGALLSEQRTVLRDGRFDYLEGQLVFDDDSGGWWYMLEAGTYYSPPAEPDESALLAGLTFDRATMESEDTTYLEFLDRMAEGEALLRADGSWHHPHPWVNVFLPDEAVETVVAETLSATGRSDIGESGLVLLYPIHRHRLGTPLLRVPDSDVVWLFALLRTGHPYDPVGTARMLQRNTELHRRSTEASGTAYPVNALPLTQHDWREHFGVAWDTLATAMQRFDPHSVLAPRNATRP